MTEQTRLILWAMLAALAASGCICCVLGPREGNTQHGRLRVSPTYTIAQGAWLKARVEAGTRPPTPVVLTSASSEDAAIAQASVLDAQTARIDGLKAGDATIKLEAQLGDDALSDTLRVRVKPVKALALESCASVGPSIYLAGHPNAVRFKFDPQTRDGGAPRGRGYYPIAIEPTAAAKLVVEDSTDDHLVLQIAPDAPDKITLRSTLPGDHRSLTIEVAQPDTVKIALLKVSEPGVIKVGGEGVTYVYYSTFDAERGEVSICAMLPYVVEASEECRFSANNALRDAGKSIYAAGVGLAIEGLRVGMCKVSVRTEISNVMVMGAMSLITIEAVQASGGGLDFD